MILWRNWLRFIAENAATGIGRAHVQARVKQYARSAGLQRADDAGRDPKAASRRIASRTVSITTA